MSNLPLLSMYLGLRICMNSIYFSHCTKFNLLCLILTFFVINSSPSGKERDKKTNGSDNNVVRIAFLLTYFTNNKKKKQTDRGTCAAISHSISLWEITNVFFF